MKILLLCQSLRQGKNNPIIEILSSTLAQICFQLRLGIELKVAPSTFWYLLGILILYVTISPDITQIKREVAVFLLQKQLYHMILFISTLIYYWYAFPEDFAVICNGFLGWLLMHLWCNFRCKDRILLPNYLRERWGLIINDNLMTHRALCSALYDILTWLCLIRFLMSRRILRALCLFWVVTGHCWYVCMRDSVTQGWQSARASSGVPVQWMLRLLLYIWGYKVSSSHLAHGGDIGDTYRSFLWVISAGTMCWSGFSP